MDGMAMTAIPFFVRKAVYFCRNVLPLNNRKKPVVNLGGRMYFFVRFTGIVTIILSILFMLLGVATVVYGYVQNTALVAVLNTYLFEGSNMRMVDARLVASLVGLFLFVSGMLSAAMGQLLMLFADVATNTRETNILLRGMKPVD